MNAPSYQWLIELRDPASGTWAPDGGAAWSRGFAMYTSEDPCRMASRILANWTADAGSAAATCRWRVTVWAYDPTRPRMPEEPVAVVQTPPPALVSMITLLAIASKGRDAETWAAGASALGEVPGGQERVSSNG